MNEIPSRYNPKDSEDKWYKFWEENNYFSAKADSSKKSFCIVIPPPNVTGILHMGHALNNTIQDILIRYHRLKGEESLWMPGTDHAGIATQNVVEKAIAKDGLKRQDLGREKFIERVWQWKEQYGSTIIRQLKKLGASCDWPRTRFTMDEQYSKAVKEVFIILWEKGLIYQDDKVINWCPRCQTALSDEEAPHRELEGNLYYFKYPFKDNPDEFVVVATTRPETMLGDTAVAVNPKDKRYKKLVGKTLILPLVNREIKIIADSMVDMKFGTGAVKVTPAHDPNDYVLGKKHKLDFVNVMHPDGRMNENAGDYKDMDRFQAREVVLEDLKEKGLLEKVEPHQLSAGHCYRCQTIIEPYLSRQWFVKMGPLAKPAIEAVKKGKIKFYPKRWTKVYLNWMENIQNWCISRQIWWGHRIPAWYCANCYPELKDFIRIEPKGGIIDQPLPEHPYFELKDNAKVRELLSRISPIVSQEKPSCKQCNSKDGMLQDLDVLDTWFSSWLWPFATFYWPEESKDLKYFYPTSSLVTAPEIIFFWVARMIMAGLEFMKDIPFKDVYIHGTVRDIEGKKMSKSLGNIIDPLEIINEYGADALRFSLIATTAQGQDVFLSKERFEQGRNFANKIWNASRFILMNLPPHQSQYNEGELRDWCGGVDLCTFFKKESLNLVNRWILSRFYSVLRQVNKNLDSYKFNEAANLLYGFFWHEFCDWYLEIIKPDIKNRGNQVVVYKILEKFLRAMHPFMPFVTEEIWQRLPHEGDSIMTGAWPHVQEQMIDKKAEAKINSIFGIITEIRNLRSEIEIPLQEAVLISLYPHIKIAKQLIEENKSIIINLAKLEDLKIMDLHDRPRTTVSAITKEADLYLHLPASMDITKEQNKIREKIARLGQIRKSKEVRLKNSEFIKKAPEEIVEKEKSDIQELEKLLKRLEKMCGELR